MATTDPVAVRPPTGEEYLESLRDGREVWLHGERVEDVTTHPAFRNSARSIARLYDALHDPEHSAVLTRPGDTGSGSPTHPFFVTPRSEGDLVASRDAIVAWQRLVYGWMGRAPDYKASFLGTLGANADYYAPYEENARRWYREAQERVVYMNHALASPPVDRSRPADEATDVVMHVERETDAGIVVSGAKVVATGSALTHANFIGHTGAPLSRRDCALVFTVPMHARGVKLISRVSYEYQAALLGSPFDYPLSSRLDENDAILVFDRVLVPWENVFVYGDLDKTNDWGRKSGTAPRMFLHGCTRLAVKMDFIAGLLLKAVAVTGSKDRPVTQYKVGEVLGWRNLFWAISDGMVHAATPWVGGAVQPNVDYGNAFRLVATVAYPTVKDLIEKTVSSGLIYLTSHASDFKSAELRPVLDRYVRGSGGADAVERVKTMKLLWDALGTEFGGRHELYEFNYLGNDELIRTQLVSGAETTGLADGLRGFAEQCMAEYDLDGWVGDRWIDPGDVSVVAPRDGAAPAGGGR
jgi:4-hydroxyphenylacetate 3-monooxygenase